jgi:hypothetical protein
LNLPTAALGRADAAYPACRNLAICFSTARGLMPILRAISLSDSSGSVFNNDKISPELFFEPFSELWEIRHSYTILLFGLSSIFKNRR